MVRWPLALAAATRFVLYTSPTTQQVMYWRAPAGSWEDPSVRTDLGENPGRDAVALLNDANGVKAPTGICVDQVRRGLYVTDPVERKILRYILVPVPGGKLDVYPDAQTVITNVASRWCAVDSLGSLFFSDEGESVIYKVPASKLVDPTEGAVAFLEGQTAAGTYKAEPVADLSGDPIFGGAGKLYPGDKVPSVSGPGGVAVDNFRVFWANKMEGTQVGSVVQGFEAPSDADRTKTLPIAKNTNKVYGVCLSASNVFFTEEKYKIHGVKKFGGAIATINVGLHSPRGCAWDGDGTIYVADEGGDQVYSFPANQKALGPTSIQKAFIAQRPVGVAVFQSCVLALGLAALVA